MHVCGVGFEEEVREFLHSCPILVSLFITLAPFWFVGSMSHDLRCRQVPSCTHPINDGDTIPVHMQGLEASRMHSSDLKTATHTARLRAIRARQCLPQILPPAFSIRTHCATISFVLNSDLPPSLLSFAQSPLPSPSYPIFRFTYFHPPPPHLLLLLIT